MTIISDSVTLLASFVTNTISYLGYGGIVILMAFESMVIPLPSELVMPFAGFLAETGRFNIWLVILFSGLGSIIGSLISYWIGRYGGNALVVRFGKYLFLDAADLKWAEDWFAKSGDKTIFISRFIPAVRHVISVPAGIGKMNVWKFSLYTFVGATIWNGILAYAGFYLGQRWDLVEKYVGIVSHAAAVLLVLALLYVVIRHIRHHRKSKALEEEMEEQDVS